MAVRMKIQYAAYGFPEKPLRKVGGLLTGKKGMKVWTEPLNPLEIEDIFLIPGETGVKSFLHTEGEKDSCCHL